MEIEKKYLVNRMPEKLEQYDRWEIEQCYLCAHPAIRVRRKNDQYLLTYKNRPGSQSLEESSSLCISQEVEVPLTREAYEHLKKKADGICIIKTRYRIPYRDHVIELDLFHGSYDGFCLAEVEFCSVQEGMDFTPPEWFGRDVSGDYHYTNSYMALESERS